MSDRGRRFAPIEGEFWLVEMQTTGEDPDYYGPFASEDEARQWGRRKGANWGDFVIIHALPPRVWTEEYGEDEGDEEDEA